MADVTVVDTELEQDKNAKIAAVAARGAGLAAELGQDPEQVEVFLQHYFRHVDPVDIDSRSVEDLLGLVSSHYRAALQRRPGEPVVRTRLPRQSRMPRRAAGLTSAQLSWTGSASIKTCKPS